MNLNELIKLRNLLSAAFDLSNLKQGIDSNFSKLSHLANDTEVEYKTLIDNLAHKHQQSYSQFLEHASELDSIITFIQNNINEKTTKFFNANYQLELLCSNAETVRKIRHLTYDENFSKVLTQRINLHSNWQYPALEIGCRDGEWTKLLVASTPLYISDIDAEFFESALKQFPDVFQSRVLRYIIKDVCIIDNLPINQFGLIFSYNYFNYLSFDSIKTLLQQSFEWLRPGGSIIFTYNNCDLPAAASHAENYFMTYVPKSLLVPLVKSLGFETIFSYDNEPAFSMLELKKPGTLKSIKLSQSLGEIRYKN